MDAQLVAQRDFSAGQIDETALRADDTEIQRAALRRARNVRILASRSLARRPGRRVLFSTTGICEKVRPASGVEWFMCFEATGVIFRSHDLTLTTLFGGLPWTQDMLKDLTWVESGGSVIVAHQGMQPQVFSYDRNLNSWSYNPFNFALDPNASTREPFHNFQLGSGITLTPSARFGSITINFTGNVLSPAHVGARFRYAERQMIITAVLSTSQATATVVELLPPTFIVNLDNVAGLQRGDVVEGLTSGTKGQVTDISGSAASILVTKNWNGFNVEDEELIVGPRSKMKVASQSETDPAGTEQWDESLISAYRGWPGCVSKDAQRIIFCRFAQAGSAIVWSSTGTLNDFRVGAEKEDAIFEFVPESCTVQDVVGGADEFVMTDRGCYYIPVSTSNPLIPGSIDFRLISDDPSSTLRPRSTTEGLLFVNSSLTRVFAIVGTGQTARPYVIEDLSEYHSSLIRQPIAVATSSADVSAPERYVYACNSDGTLAVGRYQKGASTRGWVGWVPWDGQGRVEWISAGADSVIATTEYQTTIGPQRFVEVFDDNLLLDASQAIATPTGSDALEITPGVFLEVAAGDVLALSASFAVNWAAGTRLSVERGGWYRGEYVIQSDGSLDGVIPVTVTAGMVGGFNFDVEIEPFVPHVEGGGKSAKQRLRRRRIKQIGATVQRSQAIEVAGRLVPFYRAGENEEVAPAMRDETYRSRVAGREFDPRWSLKQDLPGALTVLELATEVTI